MGPAGITRFVETDTDFNPPTPYGVGRHHLSDQPRDYRFQSTHPAWGGTHDREGVRNPVNFNPPTPHGVGPSFLFGLRSNTDFNPPTPHGVGRRRCPLDFNPPTPHGVGQNALQSYAEADVLISIHPPRMGWDYRGCCGFVRVKDFNPPTPHGVGQASGFTKTNLINFNPPTPHGVGQVTFVTFDTLL